MENIWNMIINSFNYFNIFKKNKGEILEDVDKLEEGIVDKNTNSNSKSYMEHYLIHNDPLVMSEWDYLIRLHIR
jgi:hypothetical protein